MTEQILSALWTGLAFLIHLAFVARAVLRPHREPASRVAWVVVILGLPVAGIVAYLLLGETSIGRRRVARVREVLADRACWPFTRWATPPAGFQFLRVLVEWLLAPLHPWFLGHHCERCGLGVPLRITFSTDPPPPPTLVVLPACPASGGATTFTAATRGSG